MKSRATPVSAKPGASNAMFFTTRIPGDPTGWTVSEPPSTRSSGCSSPNFVVTAAATMNRISPVWVNSVASFVYWWRSP